MPGVTVAEFVQENAPRKIKAEEDEEDDVASILVSGPFENTKRKSSLSATQLRKELGSPRMTAGDMSALNDFFEDNNSVQFSEEEQSTTYEGKSVRDEDRSFSSSSARSTFLQELGSALVSCGGVGGSGGNPGLRRSRSGSSANPHVASCHAPTKNDLVKVAAGLARLKDSIHKAVKGDLDAAKEAWRQQNCAAGGSAATSDGEELQCSESQDSFLTSDQSFMQQQKLIQQDEEAQQLRRLTSWGTVGTFETIDTVGTAEMLNMNPSQSRGPTVDDDGIPINANLLHKTHKVASKRPPRRKRVVRFDYPPISSLRECPRTQPEQIKELFFTENELEQIEDDRYSTISADDVEIVAISTSATNDSEAETPAEGLPPSSSASSPSSNSQSGQDAQDAHSANFRNYVATPSKGKREGRKGKRAFSFDDPKKRASGSSSRGGAAAASQPSTPATASTVPAQAAASPASVATTSVSPRRMIKSVQIYLRERSVG